MQPPHRTTRQRWLGLAALSALTFGFVTTTAMVVGATATPTPDASAISEADRAAADVDRAAAAERAGRAARPTSPAVTPPAVEAAPPPPPPAWVSPMPDAPLSSCFGSRWGGAHLGLDFAGAAGTPIRAVGAGTVLTAGWLYGGYGQSVMIDHGDGTLTHYAHTSRVLVRPGEAVAPGQTIALEGSTGNSSGPHLHFEVHAGLWHQLDPADWLRDHGVATGC
jgi:murein DD-endopeptidase MepM/ murein hydrolase activator NlpD